MTNRTKETLEMKRNASFSASSSSSSSSKSADMLAQSQPETSKPKRAQKKADKKTDVTVEEPIVSHECFFCNNVLNCRLNGIAKNVIAACDDCMGRKEEYRKAIFGYQNIIDRLNKLEAARDIDTVIVSEQVKCNSELIKKISEKQDIKDKKLNLIIYGLEEEQCIAPEPITRSILSHLNLPHVSCKAARIGSSKLVRLRFTMEKDRDEALKSAKKLKGHTEYGKVFINPDLPKSQLEANKKLRVDLKAYRENNPNIQLVIRNGQIMKKDNVSENHLYQPVNEMTFAKTVTGSQPTNLVNVSTRRKPGQHHTS